MKPFTKPINDLIKKMLEEGLSTRKIAKKLTVSQSAVQRIRQKCTKPLKNNSGGRTKKLSPQDTRRIVHYMVTGEAKSTSHAASLLRKQTGKVVSKWTVIRSLQGAKFRAVEKKKKPLISKKNVKARQAFVKKYETWTEEDWAKVIFSDETKINRYSTDGRQWNWKREGEGMNVRDFIQTVKHGGGNIKMWGCMTCFGPGSIRKIDGIMNKEIYLDILKRQLGETLENMPFPVNEIWFQHDNDPKHTAKVVKKWLSEQGFHVLEWPAQSPDLNPIENLWSMLKKALVNNYESPPSSLHILWARVQEQWELLSPAYCEKVVKGMGKRLAAVKKAKGLWTKY